MKKIMTVIATLVLLVTILLPGTALAALGSSVSDLITGAYQSSESKITFKVNGAKYTSVTYGVYYCNPNSGTNYFPSAGKLVQMGLCKKNQNVTVTVPKMGKYMIVSNSNKGDDIDYVVVNYTKITLSNKYKWTPARIVAQESAILIANTAIGAIVAIGCVPCGIAYELASGAAAIAIEVTSTNRSISVVPIKNYSWQYKYEPTSDGYKVTLLVYNTADKLVGTYYMNTIIIK